MTKIDDIVQLEPGALVDVTTGVFCGTRSWSHLITSEGCAVVNEIYGGSFHDPEEISLHVPQPQVSDTIETVKQGSPETIEVIGQLTRGLPKEETTPKLYVFAYGNAMQASEDQIMAQECAQRCNNQLDEWKVRSEDDGKRIDDLTARLENISAEWRLSIDRIKALDAELMVTEDRLKSAQVSSKFWINEAHDLFKENVDLTARLETAEAWLNASNESMADWIKKCAGLHLQMGELRESLKESRHTADVLNEEIVRRNKQIHGLRRQVAELEAPPTGADISKAYNTLMVSEHKDEAKVLLTLSRVVDRMADELEAKSGGRN